MKHDRSEGDTLEVGVDKDWDRESRRRKRQTNIARKIVEEGERERKGEK